MRSVTPVLVRSTHLDVLGHVNHTRFLEYMEWARFDWADEGGLPMARFAELGLATVVVRVDITYRHEAVMHQKLNVFTSLSSIGRSSLLIKQVVEGPDGSVCTEADVTLVLFDLKARKSARWPEELLGVLRPLVYAGAS